MKRFRQCNFSIEPTFSSMTSKTWSTDSFSNFVKHAFSTPRGNSSTQPLNTVSFASITANLDDLSFEKLVDEGERLQCLSAAITCAVLAPAGPPRSRILA